MLVWAGAGAREAAGTSSQISDILAATFKTRARPPPWGERMWERQGRAGEPAVGDRPARAGPLAWLGGGGGVRPPAWTLSPRGRREVRGKEVGGKKFNGSS